MLFFKGLRKTQRFSRLVQIGLAIVLLLGLIQLWQTSLLHGQQLLKSQTQKMARLLVQQTAYGAAPALQLQNDEQLTWLANALVLDPKVMSATIYSEQGQRLAFAQSVIKGDLELDPESSEVQNLLAPYPPFVEPVTQSGNNLGYVEVRLDERRFFDHIKEAHELNMRQQQVMLLIAGIIGLLLSRSFSFKRAYVDRKKTRIHRLKKRKLSGGKEKHSGQEEQEENKQQDE